MRLRRKSEQSAETDADLDGEVSVEAVPGPYDADELPAGDTGRVDLGALLIGPEPGRELRLHVDDATGAVQAVMLLGEDGALQLRAFAAPRNGDLWSEARPKIAAEVAEHGGTATEREGRWGPELVCKVQVKTPEGRVGTQETREIGVNGPRWLLRATLLGKPAADIEGSTDWEDVISRVAVQRGAGAMPVGEALTVTMPPEARAADQPE